MRDFKTSYLDSAAGNRTLKSDEAAGSVEAGKTSGAGARGSDESPDPFVRSSTPNGNLGRTHGVHEPAYEDGHDE